MKKKLKHEFWVEKRMKCTLKNTFRSLGDVIEKDIQRFNELDESSSENWRYAYVRENSRITVGRAVEPKPIFIDQTVKIWLMSDKIEVCLGKKVLFTVIQKWSVEDGKCELRVKDKAYTIWQISQMAIGDLLFDCL